MIKAGHGMSEVGSRLLLTEGGIFYTLKVRCQDQTLKPIQQWGDKCMRKPYIGYVGLDVKGQARGGGKVWGQRAFKKKKV